MEFKTWIIEEGGFNQFFSNLKQSFQQRPPQTFIGKGIENMLRAGEGRGPMLKPGDTPFDKNTPKFKEALTKYLDELHDRGIVLHNVHSIKAIEQLIFAALNGRDFNMSQLEPVYDEIHNNPGILGSTKKVFLKPEILVQVLEYIIDHNKSLWWQPEYNQKYSSGQDHIEVSGNIPMARQVDPNQPQKKQYKDAVSVLNDTLIAKNETCKYSHNQLIFKAKHFAQAQNMPEGDLNKLLSYDNPFIPDDQKHYCKAAYTAVDVINAQLEEDGMENHYSFNKLSMEAHKLASVKQIPLGDVKTLKYK